MSDAARSSDPKADLRRLFVGLVKLALVDGGIDAAAWRREVSVTQARLAIDPGVLAALELDDLWTSAMRLAESDPVVRRDETVNPMLPTMAPVRPPLLTATPFDIDGAVQAIREAASFG